MMREIEFTILENKPITDDICKMVLECSAGEHGITAPGQFINIKIDGLFLRRPISICDWTETTVTVIYKVVGKGTELLKTYEPGRQLNALSALGNGFAPARAGQRPLLIGGGELRIHVIYKCDGVLHGHCSGGNLLLFCAGTGSEKFLRFLKRFPVWIGSGIWF